MRENAIEGSFARAIRKRGGLCYKFVSPGNSGVPDRLIVLPGGRVIFVELKTATGSLSPLQRQQIKHLQAQGVDVRVLYGQSQVKTFVEEVMPL